MEAITRSRNSMVFLAAAAASYALGTIFGIIAYATLSGPSAFGTFRDLGHASDWLHFVGAFLALAGVCVAGWETFPLQQRGRLAELLSASTATLLVAIGSLVNAASTSSQAAANVIVAVGIGVWAFLALARAARYNLVEQQAPGTAGPLVPLWLAACGGIVLLAVGSGFTVGVYDQGLGIATGILDALGVGVLAYALTAACSKGLLPSHPTMTVVLGLGVLAAAFVVSAVVAGLVFTSQGTLKGLRIGVSITGTVTCAGVVLLGIAAWLRVGQIVVAAGTGEGAGGSGWAMPWSSARAPGASRPPAYPTGPWGGGGPGRVEPGTTVPGQPAPPAGDWREEPPP